MAEEFKPQYNFSDDRLNELKQLFPEAWEDGVFNVDTLKTLIGEFSTDNNVKEHFGLNWVGKQDARKIAAKPPTGTLKPCPGEGVDEDSTENIFIEGENLEVLKILRKSYMSKIKMIYIDPPYNTGNDFIYKDTFADSTEDYLRKTGEKSDEGLLVSNPKSSGKYHANWLSFMYPRLRLAKDLLKEDGVIFISIDDNEIDNLRLLCDEILGEENFISCLIWEKKTGASDSKTIATITEYVIVYSKNFENSIPSFNKNKASYDLSRYKHKDEFFENRGPFYYDNLDRGGLRYSDSLNFEIKGENGEKTYPNGRTLFKNDGWIWKWGKEKVKWGFENKFLEIRESSYKESGYAVYYKNYLYVDNENKPIVRAAPMKNNISGVLNSDGSNDIKKLFEGRYFDYPKPVKFIKIILNYIHFCESDIVLDFFAGSGTTAQALFELKKEQNLKKLNFITIQIQEDIHESKEAYKDGFLTISEITKERIRRVIKSLDKTQGFKVFKQNTSTIYKWQEFVPNQDGALPDLFSKLELAYKNPLQDGVSTQDFITEVILQEGFPLTAKQEEVTSGIFKITHEWVPYTLYATMLYSFKNTDFGKLKLEETDHFICLDRAFESNDTLKQELDNQCKLFTI